MRFLGLVASQGGLFHLPENTFLKKVLQKRLNTKIFISDKPEFCGAIGAGLFAVDSDRLLERLECNALNISPKNLVILIGTNDIGLGLPTEYTLNNIKEILQRTQKLCPNTNIVLQAIYPGLDTAHIEEKAYNDMFALVVSSYNEKSSVTIYFTLSSKVSGIRLDKEAIVF